MQDRPKFSFVIPAYNRAESLPRAVASVLAQTEKDIELIVVDEASTDGTQEYLATLRDPRVRVVGRRPDSVPRRLGVAVARNLGLHAARADIVTFFDSDDVCRPNYVASHLAAYADDPDLVCVACSALMHFPDRSAYSTVPDATLPPRVFEWAVITDLFPIFAPATSLRREHAVAIGGFNDAMSLAEDREILVRLAPRGSIRLISDVLWDKSWTPGGLSHLGAKAGPQHMILMEQCPTYRARFPKVASYCTTRILVADIKRGLWGAFWRDLRAFRKAGLLEGGPLRWWNNHREVRRYRRNMRKPGALASIVDPPQRWD
ncbi:MAG: glycosyltransferase [Xanthobacteraceae bacterium]|nr:glycosyltransferase [Xanthobacteraceae bacterium]